MGIPESTDDPHDGEKALEEGGAGLPSLDSVGFTVNNSGPFPGHGGWLASLPLPASPTEGL